MFIECKNASKWAMGILNLLVVSTTAAAIGSLLLPDLISESTWLLHFFRTNAFSSKVRLEARSSTISSAYRAKPYKACTCGRLAGGNRSVAK